MSIVVGNLIASAIWAVPALIHLHWRLCKLHKAVKEGTPPEQTANLGS